MPHLPEEERGRHWHSLARMAMLLAVAIWLGLALQGNAGAAQAVFQSPTASPLPQPTPAGGLTPEPAAEAAPPNVTPVVWVVVGLLIFGPIAAGSVWLTQRRSPSESEVEGS